MSLETTVLVLGGDLRQAAVAARLAKEYFVCGWALPHAYRSPLVREAAAWQEAIGNARMLVLPLPTSPDSKHLYMPHCIEEGEKPPLISEIIAATPKNCLVAGGRLSPAIRAILQSYGITYFDYFENERLQQENAIPTAEGAVQILMQEIPRTIKGLSVGVTGFGRIAKALAQLLLAMGARVTVAARRKEALNDAAQLGCQVIELQSPVALTAFSACEAILNTVPQQIFTREVLAALPPSVLLVDLASAPGGFDKEALTVLSRRVIFALSLPGKYAPLTAGEIIADTILEYVRGEL